MLTYELPSKPGIDMAPTLTDIFHTMAGAGGGKLYLPTGNILCNSGTPCDMSGITIEGQGRGATQLDYFKSTTGGLFTSGTKRVYHNFFRDFSVRGPGSGIGLDLTNWDRGALERLRIYNWGTCVRIKSDIGFGALRNKVLNCILTNGVDRALHLTGPQGSHAAFIGWCELGSSGVGLQVDAPTDETTVWDVQLESNKQAAKIAGNRGLYYCRLEGNAANFDFMEGSGDNLLLTGYFDPSKHNDRTGDATTNQILAFGRTGGAGGSFPSDLFAIFADLRAKSAQGDIAALAQSTQIAALVSEIASLTSLVQDQSQQIAAFDLLQATIQQSQIDLGLKQSGTSEAILALQSMVASLTSRLDRLDAAEAASIAAYAGTIAS